MKRAILGIFLMMGLIVPNLTWASYLNKCLLTVKVLEETSTMTMAINGPQGEFEKSKLTMYIKILKAEKNGRADSGCQSLVNQHMRITIEQPPLTSLVKGQVVQVESITQDAFPQEGYVTQYKLKN
ncbi:hypothetical protein ACG9XR_22660 [Acinetobacter guillouiae]|uniref:hypothetical protein n=1 Tax=Acinetobacter guillouiae TaxID=106649 RepID=UPI0028D5FF35|nr:hypothetical protein [Acinetobacter guillouiae]